MCAAATSDAHRPAGPQPTFGPIRDATDEDLPQPICRACPLNAQDAKTRSTDTSKSNIPIGPTLFRSRILSRPEPIPTTGAKFRFYSDGLLCAGPCAPRAPRSAHHTIWFSWERNAHGTHCRPLPLAPTAHREKWRKQPIAVATLHDDDDRGRGTAWPSKRRHCCGSKALQHPSPHRPRSPHAWRAAGAEADTGCVNRLLVTDSQRHERLPVTGVVRCVFCRDCLGQVHKDCPRPHAQPWLRPDRPSTGYARARQTHHSVAVCSADPAVCKFAGNCAPPARLHPETGTHDPRHPSLPSLLL
mmetsp:Transcript_52378/g.111590  ORF Transcript_52378/g.111590 Transcript_52378/m.111590 type:complete len:301 (-) Transcript_52378:176-1078(-)